MAKPKTPPKIPKRTALVALTKMAETFETLARGVAPKHRALFRRRAVALRWAIYRLSGDAPK